MTLLEYLLSETKREESELMKNAQPHVKAIMPGKLERDIKLEIPITDTSVDVDAYFFNKAIRTGPNQQANMTAILKYKINNTWEKVYVGFFIADMQKYAELSMQFHGQGQVMDMLIAKADGIIVENGKERLSIINILEWCVYYARQNGFGGIPAHKSFLVDCFSE